MHLEVERRHVVREREVEGLVLGVEFSQLLLRRSELGGLLEHEVTVHVRVLSLRVRGREVVHVAEHGSAATLDTRLSAPIRLAGHVVLDPVRESERLGSNLQPLRLRVEEKQRVEAVCITTEGELRASLATSVVRVRGVREAVRLRVVTGHSSQAVIRATSGDCLRFGGVHGLHPPTQAEQAVWQQRSNARVLGSDRHLRRVQQIEFATHGLR
mmetsp:Transcript_125048/g.303600  ORF Transcript_125048/g.303600 Transcript_125048/m.303600 type:complete len:213 (-) Transcript_125048:82-720(-)